MKKLILMLSMVFSLFMSMSVFAAGDYSIGGASWDTGDRALAIRQSTSYRFTWLIRKSVPTTVQVLQSMTLQNLSATMVSETIHLRFTLLKAFPI